MVHRGGLRAHRRGDQQGALGPLHAGRPCRRVAAVGSHMARYRLRIYLPWMILVVAALLALAGLVGYLPALFPVPAQVDFAAYYLAARVLSAGGDPYSAAAL